MYVRMYVCMYVRTYVRTYVCMYYVCMYVGHLESKERFAIKKYLFDNRKEKEYAGFITHLHLLLHIVTLDTEALVVP